MIDDFPPISLFPCVRSLDPLSIVDERDMAQCAGNVEYTKYP